MLLSKRREGKVIAKSEGRESNRGAKAFEFNPRDRIVPGACAKREGDRGKKWRDQEFISIDRVSLIDVLWLV